MILKPVNNKTIGEIVTVYSNNIESKNIQIATTIMSKGANLFRLANNI